MQLLLAKICAAGAAACLALAKLRRPLPGAAARLAQAKLRRPLPVRDAAGRHLPSRKCRHPRFALSITVRLRAAAHRRTSRRLLAKLRRPLPVRDAALLVFPSCNCRFAVSSMPRVRAAGAHLRTSRHPGLLVDMAIEILEEVKRSPALLAAAVVVFLALANIGYIVDTAIVTGRPRLVLLNPWGERALFQLLYEEVMKRSEELRLDAAVHPAAQRAIKIAERLI